MKTVTVTHQNAINYGAVLQAYALHKQLEKLGVDDELLDLKRTYKIFNEVKLNKHLPGNVYSNVLDLLHIASTKKRAKLFREFVDNYINATRLYETVEEVIANPPAADAYISGSDQTFNTHWGVKPASFLRFGSEEARRISYASSMGRSEVQDKYLDEFISAIKAYSFLSVREQSSADYISKVCSVPCSRHLDPSFLLTTEEWSELASGSSLSPKTAKGKYILVYQLFSNPVLSDVLKKIKKDTGFKVIVICPFAHCRINGDKIIRDAGPLEFLDLYKNAEYVLTTSFHGTCFSLLFKKKFFSFIRKTGETRINGILELLNLGDRIITDLDQLTYDEIIYDNVNEIIEVERKKSTEYLKRSLGV